MRIRVPLRCVRYMRIVPVRNRGEHLGAPVGHTRQGSTLARAPVVVRIQDPAGFLTSYRRVQVQFLPLPR